MALNRARSAHAARAKEKKIAKKDDKASRFRRGKPAPDPGFNRFGQFDTAFPDAPSDAAGIGRTLSRGL